MRPAKPKVKDASVDSSVTNITFPCVFATSLILSVSNGFKVRHNSGNMNNSSSDTYIYALWADLPFALANAR